MKDLIRLCLLLFACAGQATAAISPLVITTSFENDSWFPLPVQQMENAAVDTALSRISETGEFAFLYKPSEQQMKSTGKLDLAVSLVEPAESAKITIRLSLPDNQGSYVSSSSISLSNLDHKGIFNALQQLGEDGASQLTASIESINTNRNINKSEQSIREQIIKLNLSIIRLDTSIGALQHEGHDSQVMETLASLDALSRKIDANQAYEQQSDLNRDRKLEAIHAEIRKLNIGSNTNNRPPDSDELSGYDATRLSLLTRARELKFDKQFTESRALLENIANDNNISSVLRGAVNEELNINLPLYEAQIVTNEVSSLFMRYLKNDEYKKKISYISDLYDSVLSQQDLSFSKRTEINQKKDQLNITGDSMDTAAHAMRESSLHMLSMSLRDAMARHNVNLAMGFKGSGDGLCPDRQTVDTALRRSKINDKVIAYNASPEQCELVIEDSPEQLLVFVFSEQESTFSRKNR